MQGFDYEIMNWDGNLGFGKEGRNPKERFRKIRSGLNLKVKEKRRYN